MIRRSPFFYGWVMVAAGGLTMTLAYSMRYSFSIFYPVMLDEFGWSQAATSLAFSINLLVYAFSSPIAGTLADKLGTRYAIPIGAATLLFMALALSQVTEIWQLYLFLGLMAFGIAAAGWPAHAANLPNWFARRRGLAMGLLTAGWGLSYLSAPITEFLISVQDWRWAYIVLGIGVAVPVAVVGYVFQRQRPEDYGLHPDGLLLSPNPNSTNTNEQAPNVDAAIVDAAWDSFDWSVATAFKTARFWMLIMMNFFTGIFLNMITLHFVKYMETVGFGRAMGASVMGLMGIITITGNLSAFISDRLGREVTYSIGMGSVALSVTILLLMRDSSLVFLPFIFAFLFGYGGGISGTTGVAAIADIFQGRNFGSINGAINIGFGMGGALGPWLAGYLVDTTDSYNLAFSIAILCVFSATACLWLASPRKIRLVGGKAARLKKEQPQ